MQKLLLRFSIIILTAFLFSSCSNNSPVSPISSRASLANRVLKHPNIVLLPRQVSGRLDNASAYHNIASAAKGMSVRRSGYGKAPSGYTRLDNNMLKAMLYLADVKGYTYRVTSIAGGSHSSNSRHYQGIAFDVDRINGRKVNYGNPYYRNLTKGKIKRKIKEKGK